jgi:hypothetical protein
MCDRRPVDVVTPATGRGGRARRSDPPPVGAALEHGNLMPAEATASQIGQVELSEALELTALIALHDAERGHRAALRWVQRWLAETPNVTVGAVSLAAGCLRELGGVHHHRALAALRGRAAVTGPPAAVRHAGSP